MSLGFHEQLRWHVHFVGRGRNHESNCGKLFVGESTFVVEGVLERRVLRTFLSLM